jgi:hypothetical protein
MPNSISLTIISKQHNRRVILWRHLNVNNRSSGFKFQGSTPAVTSADVYISTTCADEIRAEYKKSWTTNRMILGMLCKGR